MQLGWIDFSKEDRQKACLNNIRACAREIVEKEIIFA